MDVSGDYLFDAPQELVWNALQDPGVLGSVMPGGKGFTTVGENQYSGMLEVKVGPVQGAFQGMVTLTEVVPPERYTMQVDGKGAPGFVKATGTMHLEARGSQTFMEYTGQAHVGGRIASVGQRLMDSAARSIIRQSLEALNEYLKAQVAAQPPAAEPAPPVTPLSKAPEAESAMPDVPSAPISTVNDVTPTAPAPPVVPISAYTPPTHTSLAMNMAKDMISDSIPARYQPWVIGACIAVVLLILWWLASR